MQNCSNNSNKIKRDNKKNRDQINILKNKLSNINDMKNIMYNNNNKKFSRADLIKKKNFEENSKLIKGEINELKSNLIKDDNKKNKRVKRRRPSSKKRKKLSAKKRK
jgi:hypothetical protein